MGPALESIEQTMREISGTILNAVDSVGESQDEELRAGPMMGRESPESSDDEDGMPDLVEDEATSEETAVPTLGEHLRMYEAQRQRDMEEQRGLGPRF